MLLAAAASALAFPFEPPPFLLKRINPGASSGISSTNWTQSLSGSGLFERFVELDGVLYFGANDGVNGKELWRSDGTEAGTWLVKDINPGPGSSMTDWPWTGMAVSGGKLFLSVLTASDGYELWVSDGTAAGTVMVKDIRPGPAWSLPNFFIDFNDTLYFQANDGVNGVELWKSDGTAAGTVLVKDIRPGSASGGPTQLQGNVLGSRFVLGADDGVAGSEVWVSDGTTAGTVLLKDIYPGAAGSSAGMNTRIDGILYFPATTPAEGRELWRTDGTTAGTFLVKDIRPGAASSNPTRPSQEALGGSFFFSANDGVNGEELWKSDGSAAGTVMVQDINPGSTSASPGLPLLVGAQMFFGAAEPVNGRELWRSDGTAAGTVLVKDINPGTASSTPLNGGTGGGRGALDVGGTLVFGAFTALEGYEMWTSDGTAGGTVMAPNFLPGPNWGAPTVFTYVPSRRQVFLGFDTPNGQRQLWSFYKNNAPDTSAAYLTPEVLWPPQGDMVPIEVVGVTDPDGDPVDVMITSVFSDEPVSFCPDPDEPASPRPPAPPSSPTSADAVLGSPTTVRAERCKHENGRVYTTSFTAMDVPFGAASDGTGVVCTPLRKPRPAPAANSGCVNDGPLYDATQP
jgi:ELWxxDGT repeat protein